MHLFSIPPLSVILLSEQGSIGKELSKVKDLHELSLRARKSFYDLSASPVDQRNRAILSLAEILNARFSEISKANLEDCRNAESEDLASPLLHRLLFDEKKLSQTVDGLKALAALEDPLGNTTYSMEITEGLTLYRVVCPIGVIGVIFESRPDALIQIASLCIKSGNAVLLKGGREAIRTNQILCDCVRKALLEAGLPADSAQLLETREDVASMLKEDSLIDLIIPRGSRQFVQYIMDNSRIPVLGHSDGICHVYIDEFADPALAVRVALDSKTQNVSVCNAAETFLVHERIAPVVLPLLAEALEKKGVEIRGDNSVAEIIKCRPASDLDWETEYLDYIISIKTVSSLSEAIRHINRYGSHHTDCICTENSDNASVFMQRVDSSGVYWNVSTRFSDGFVYGFGAEVGIATGKIHARGPMGLEGLTTYKYKLIGNGHTMAEMKNGTCFYTHKKLNSNCPF